MKSKTILIVEDDQLLIEMYAKKFANNGFRVLKAFDGEQALEELAKAKDKPTVVMLDIMLPKIDGFTVLKKIRENPETKDIPVVLSTNLGRSHIEEQKGKELGATGFLVKSDFTLTEIVEKVKSYIK